MFNSRRGLQLAFVLVLTGIGLLISTLFTSLPSASASDPNPNCLYDPSVGWQCITPPPTPTVIPPPTGTGGGGTIIPSPSPDPIIKTSSFTVIVYYFLGQTKTPLKDAKVTYTDNEANRTKIQNTATNGQTTFSLGTTSTSSYSLKAEKTNCSTFSQTYTTRPSDKEIILSCNIGNKKPVITVDIEPTADTLEPYQVLSKDEILSNVTISPDIKNPIVFNLKRSGNLSASQTINLSLSGSAKLGTDYTITGVSKLNFTKTIKPNENKILLFVVPKALKNGTNIILIVKAGSGYDVGKPSKAEVKVGENGKLLISVLHPDINEEYKAGEQEKIWWDMLNGDQPASQADINNIKSFSLSLAKDGNNFDTVITDSIDKTKVVVNNQNNRFMYDFDNVPCQISNNVKVKIKAFDNTGKQIAEGISLPFKITYGEIHIISPQSGQTLKGAEETTVEWEGSCLPEVKTTKVSYTITSVPKTNKPNVGVDYSEQLASYDGIPKDNKMTFTNPVFRNVRANLFVKLYDNNGVEVSHSAIPIVFHTPKVNITGLQNQTIELGGTLNLSWEVDNPKMIEKFKVYKILTVGDDTNITNTNIQLDTTVPVDPNTNRYSASMKIDPVFYDNYNKVIVSAITKYQQIIGESNAKIKPNYSVNVKITKPPISDLATSKVTLEWTANGDIMKIKNFVIRIVRMSDNNVINTITLPATARSQLVDIGSKPHKIVKVDAIDEDNIVIGNDYRDYFISKPQTFYGKITDNNGNLISANVEVIFKEKNSNEVSKKTIKTIVPFNFNASNYNFKFIDQFRKDVVYSFYVPKLKGKTSENPLGAIFKNGYLLQGRSGVIDMGNNIYTLKLFNECGSPRNYTIESYFQPVYNFSWESCPIKADEKAISEKIKQYFDDIRARYIGKTPSIKLIRIRNQMGGTSSDDFEIKLPFDYVDGFLKNHSLLHIVYHEYSHLIDFQRNLTNGAWKSHISNSLLPVQTCLNNYDPTKIKDNYPDGYSCYPSKMEFVSVWGEQNSLHKDKIPGAIAPLNSRRKDIANSLWSLIQKEMR